MKNVLYFGIFDPEFSRNKVYIRGLRENGVRVIICTDNTPGLLKYWHLFRKHWALRKKYDVMIVGYPGYIIVPFARLITRKRIIFDALCSFFETEILSRDALHEIPFRKPYARSIDWFATRCADTILVETEAQKKYFEEKLGVRQGKCIVVYTGVDDNIFRPDETVKPFERFTALFRGRITHEAGVDVVLRAAKLLENKNINFLIIGYGWNKEKEQFDRALDELMPKNVRHIKKQLQFEELIPLMQKCHVALGQFSDHERLKRTIPHKAFEALAMKLPYITASADGINEILKEDQNFLTVTPNNPEDLAKKILLLHDQPDVRSDLSLEGNSLYKYRFVPQKIVGPLLKSLS